MRNNTLILFINFFALFVAFLLSSCKPHDNDDSIPGLAGNEGEINSDICNSVGASKGRGIVHETMHFLGLLDRCSGNRSFKGFEKDIMGVDARIATLFDDSHYLSFIEKYKEVDMSGRPYILLIDRIDVMQTEQLKRVNVIEEL